MVALIEPELPPVEVCDGHRTYRPVTPGVWPRTDLRCFTPRGVARIVPVHKKPFLRASCRIRLVVIDGRDCLEANVLDVGFWDSCEAGFWQAQLSLSADEAGECEADALALVA